MTGDGDIITISLHDCLQNNTFKIQLSLSLKVGTQCNLQGFFSMFVSIKMICQQKVMDAPRAQVGLVD